jgi:type II secretory pathway pseudopilin PulG
MVNNRQHGFTFIAVMFLVAVLAGGLALAGDVWLTSAIREREADLLFVGNQYRRAIRLYYEATPGLVKRYPRSLEDLIKDERQASNQRYLRRLYADPITGGNDWGIVAAPDGGILGVYSRSEAEPLKIAGFRVRDAGFESMRKYSDWKFVHIPYQSVETRSPTP